MGSRGAAVAGAFAVTFAAAWALSDVPLYLDDFTYMLLAELHRDEWFCWLDPQGWFSHFRPWFYFCWWFFGPLRLDGGAVRAVQVVAWAFTVVFVGDWAFRRRGWPGLAAVVAGLPLNAAFVELLGWKSWLTSTGTLAGLAVGLVELTRERPRWAVVLAAGGFALGFKETGAFVLGLVALLGGLDRAAVAARRFDRPVMAAGAGLVAASIGAASFAAQKTSPMAFFANLPANASGMVPIGWIAAAAVAGRAPAPALALVGALLLLPPLVAVPVVVAAAAWLLRERPGWWLAAIASWAVANIGIATSRPYLLDGWLVVLVGWVGFGEVPRRGTVWALAAGFAAVLLTRWGVELRAQAPAAREQRAFLASFDPAPAKGLWVPPEGYRIDLDLLVWLDRGAVSLMDAPSNSQPVQVGPRSGIWADVVAIDPKLPMEAPAMRPGLYKLAPGAPPPGPGHRPRGRRPK